MTKTLQTRMATMMAQSSMVRAMTIKVAASRVLMVRALMGGAVFIMAATSSAMAHDYKIKITNLMTEEYLAPILIAPMHEDNEIFTKHNYVSEEAEVQMLTGDPAELAKEIGRKAKIIHGTDGLGDDGKADVLLAPGKSVEITIDDGRRKGLRLIAMVAPTKTPDHFVTAIINPKAQLSVTMDRYDIGHNEGREKIQHIRSAATLVEVSRVDDND